MTSQHTGSGAPRKLRCLRVDGGHKVGQAAKSTFSCLADLKIPIHTWAALLCQAAMASLTPNVATASKPRLGQTSALDKTEELGTARPLPKGPGPATLVGASVEHLGLGYGMLQTWLGVDQGRVEDQVGRVGQQVLQGLAGPTLGPLLGPMQQGHELWHQPSPHPWGQAWQALQEGLQAGLWLRPAYPGR